MTLMWHNPPLFVCAGCSFLPPSMAANPPAMDVWLDPANAIMTSQLLNSAAGELPFAACLPQHDPFPAGFGPYASLPAAQLDGGSGGGHLGCCGHHMLAPPAMLHALQPAARE